MLQVPLSPDMENRLREKAAAAGQDPATFVMQLVRNELAIDEPMPEPDADTSERMDSWVAEFRAWVESHPLIDHAVDDSRESIYADR
jgi:hypothetical protein